MRKMRVVWSMMLIGLLMASCTVVKSPQADNFKRVKYNSHLKLAKSDKKEKPVNTVSSFNEKTTHAVESSEKLKPMSTQTQAIKELTVSTKKTIAKPKMVLKDKLTFEKSKEEIKGIFYHESDPWNSESNTISNYVNSLAPAASSEELPLGDILYIVLVVLLVLIVLSLIADLAGGLIGALLAILLILLILRLLGYV